MSTLNYVLYTPFTTSVKLRQDFLHILEECPNLINLQKISESLLREHSADPCIIRNVSKICTSESKLFGILFYCVELENFKLRNWQNFTFYEQSEPENITTLNHS